MTVAYTNDLHILRGEASEFVFIDSLFDFAPIVFVG